MVSKKVSEKLEQVDWQIVRARRMATAKKQTLSLYENEPDKQRALTGLWSLFEEADFSQHTKILKMMELIWLMSLRQNFMADEALFPTALAFEFNNRVNRIGAAVSSLNNGANGSIDFSTALKNKGWKRD